MPSFKTFSPVASRSVLNQMLCVSTSFVRRQYFVTIICMNKIQNARQIILFLLFNRCTDSIVTNPSGERTLHDVVGTCGLTSGKILSNGIVFYHIMGEWLHFFTQKRLLLSHFLKDFSREDDKLPSKVGILSFFN